MSLSRSASGPAGGLTINTGAANSLAPPPSQPAGSGGLFGSGSASATATTTTTGGMATAGGLFGNAPKPAGSSLFGGGSTAAPAAGAGTGTGGGLFGNNAPAGQAPAAGGTGGGLFGGAAANASTPQQTTGGGGLFGNTANTQQQPAQQPAATGGGLFGNTQSQPQQQQQQQQQASGLGGGLFGQATQNQQQQPAQQSSSSSLFGGKLFGGSTPGQQPAQTGGGLLGGLGNNQAKDQPNTQTAGGGMFAQNQQNSQNQSTNQVPAVQINYDNLRPRSRFDDLAQPIQDEISLIDKGIQRVIKMRDEIGGFMPQHERDIEQLGRDVHFVETKFKTVQVALNRDIMSVKALQDLTKKNITDAQLSFKAADNLKLPTHYHQTSLFAAAPPPPPTPDANAADASSAHAGAQDLITYFNRVCDDVDKYKRRIDEYRAEIERDMPGVENGLYEQIRVFRDRSIAAAALNTGAPVQDQLGQILSAIRETGSAIVAQAGQMADTRERLSRLQAGILRSGMYGPGVPA